MLRPAYLSKKLTPPISTKDGGTLRTILEACEYMAAIGKERELCPHWREVRELMLLVMQSIENSMRPDATDPLNRAREWRVFVQRSVRSQIVVIAGIGLQDTA